LATKTRLQRVIVFAAMVAATVGGLAAPAAAATGGGTVSPDAVLICDPNYQYANFTSHSTPWYLTHATGYTIPSGGTGSVSKTVSKIGSVTAAVSYSSSAKVSADVVFGSLEGTVGVSIEASGTITVQTSETVTVNLNSSGRYVFFDGVHKASGNWSGGICNGSGTAVTYTNGSAVSWSITWDGAVNCASSYPSGSLEALARARC
jgi:hypothetical protein